MRRRWMSVLTAAFLGAVCAGGCAMTADASTKECIGWAMCVGAALALIEAAF